MNSARRVRQAAPAGGRQMRGELLSDLPAGVRALLAAAPLTEKKLLEIAVSWPRAVPAQARMADALRLFVITWDPLERLAPRPDAMVTVNADPSDLELVVYVPCWSLASLAAGQDATVAEILSALAGSAVGMAVEHEQAVLSGNYPDLATQGVVPDLRGDLAAGAALGPAQIRLVSRGWEDIGLGAITDMVQHAYGSVELDRSPVVLAAGPAPRLECPACHGRRFGFPGDLAESRERMCPQHQGEATAVINRRLARANASNPDGWAALTDASVRLDRPHLPNGLATRHVGAEEGRYVIPEPEVLAERSALVVEAASWFAGRPHELSLALGQEPEAAALLPDWLVTLVLDLGRARLGAEATALGDALTGVDPDNAATYAADVAVALAEAGLADEARARIAAMLDSWPDDFWCRVHAGDALAALRDVDAAETHFTTARQMAEEADDFAARSDAVERLVELRRRDGAAGEPEPRRGQRSQPHRKPSRSQRAHTRRKRK